MSDYDQWEADNVWFDSLPDTTTADYGYNPAGDFSLDTQANEWWNQAPSDGGFGGYGSDDTALLAAGFTQAEIDEWNNANGGNPQSQAEQLAAQTEGFTDEELKAWQQSGGDTSEAGLLKFLQGIGASATKANTFLQGIGYSGGLAGLLGTGANITGGFLQNKAATSAARTQADAMVEAAKIAADTAKFRPVGVSTRFGDSKFGYDGNGNLNSAGYTLSPEIKTQQDALLGASGGMLNQYLAAQPGYQGAPPPNRNQAIYSKPQGFADGGLNPSDTVPAMLTPGEFVVNKEAARLIGHNKLNKLNQQGLMKRIGYADGGVVQPYTGSIDNSTTSPMGWAAESMFNLGNQYLGTSPQAQAAQYNREQQALLAAGRERDFAQLQNTMYNQGRQGIAVGGTSTGMQSANPQLEAWYNANRQQDLGVAANATQGGMDYAKYGAGIVGLGGGMLRDMYQTQSDASIPWRTAMGNAQYLEGLGQNAMTLGTNLGSSATAANASAGSLLADGYSKAATINAGADARSPWGTVLGTAGNALNQYSYPQQPKYSFDPYTGKALV